MPKVVNGEINDILGSYAVGEIGSGTSAQGVYYQSNFNSPQALKIPAGETGVRASNLNRSGAIVGSTADPLDPEPLYWSSPTATPIKLALPAGYSEATAASINDSGQIVGLVIDGGQYFPVYWSSSTAIAAFLKVPSGAMNVRALHINNNGQILGTIGFSEGCFWTAPIATATVLNKGARTSGYGTTLLEDGVVLGHVWSSAEGHDPAYWRSSGMVVDLIAVLPGETTGKILSGWPNAPWIGESGGKPCIFEASSAKNFDTVLVNSTLGPIKEVTLIGESNIVYGEAVSGAKFVVEIK